MSGPRRWLLSDVKGRVLEVGAGTGRNFGYYDEECKVVATDVNLEMLEMAKKKHKEEVGDDAGTYQNTISHRHLVEPRTLLIRSTSAVSSQRRCASFELRHFMLTCAPDFDDV